MRMIIVPIGLKAGPGELQEPALIDKGKLVKYNGL